MQPWRLHDGTRVDVCPAQLVDRDVWVELFGAYQRYKNGFLPAPGAANDQAAWLLDAFRFIDAEYASARESRIRSRNQG